MQGPIPQPNGPTCVIDDEFSTGHLTMTWCGIPLSISPSLLLTGPSRCASVLIDEKSVATTPDLTVRLEPHYCYSSEFSAKGADTEPHSRHSQLWGLTAEDVVMEPQNHSRNCSFEGASKIWHI